MSLSAPQPLTATLLFVGVSTAAACQTQDVVEPPRAIILISMDTARADALGCYEANSHWGLDFPASTRPKPQTPTLDRLAESGVRFEWALSHAPTTLSSHTSMFTGLDPHGHGVPRNGYPLSTELPLLTEVLATQGWDTIAVIGSSALEKKMGLARGFRVYDDPGPQPAGGMYMRNAAEVTDRTLAALDARETSQDQDLFLFAHYYDAHMPWFTAPDALVERIAQADYSGPVDGSMESIAFLWQRRVTGTLRYGDARHARALYLAQVAYVDQEIDRLLRGLEARGLRNNSLVIVTSDHGEVLDEDPKRPYTHGPSTALEATHVPLIFHGQGSMALPSGKVFSQRVHHIDLAKTVLTAAGLPASLGAGRDLSPLWAGESISSMDGFAEATKPMNLEQHHKWNNANLDRSIFRDGHQLRFNPSEGGRATLNRIASGSPRSQDMERLRSMLADLKGWDAAAPAWVPPSWDDETRAALEALGYIDPSSTPAPQATQPASPLTPSEPRP